MKWFFLTKIISLLLMIQDNNNIDIGLLESFEKKSVVITDGK